MTNKKLSREEAMAISARITKVGRLNRALHFTQWVNELIAEDEKHHEFATLVLDKMQLLHNPSKP